MDELQNIYVILRYHGKLSSFFSFYSGVSAFAFDNLPFFLECQG